MRTSSGATPAFAILLAQVRVGVRVGALVALGLAGCKSYPERTAVAYEAFVQGRFEDAHTRYSDPDLTGSAFLSGAEAGMVALAAGEWEAAVLALTAAADQARELEERALASPQALGEDLLSFALNEGAQAYSGEGYERVLLHAALALAYLAQGRLDAVSVEARRANRLLESEEELYDKQYAAGGLGHFVSATSYELSGEYDQAYIDYERMVAKDLGTELAGEALIRIADWLGYTEERARWVARFGERDLPGPDAATIVVIAGLGVAPQKREVLIQIPTPRGLVQWAVPRFVPFPRAVDALILRSNGAALARTVTIEDVSRVAHANLEDRIAWLGAKSAIRATLKLGLTHELGRDHGVLGLIAGSVFSAATERADLRSWRTLPAAWHAARSAVEPGVHDIVLDAAGGASVSLGAYELEPGETLFVLARTLSTRVHAHVIGGGAVVAAGPVPQPAPPLARSALLAPRESENQRP